MDRGANIFRQTQVLTSSGFVPISKYNGEQVMQVDSEFKYSFEYPLGIESMDYSGIYFIVSGRGIKYMVTPDAYVPYSPRSDKNYIIRKRADSIVGDPKPRYWHFSPNGSNNWGMDISDEILRANMFIRRHLYPVEGARYFAAELLRVGEKDEFVSALQKANIIHHSFFDSYGIECVEVYETNNHRDKVFPISFELVRSLSDEQLQVCLNALFAKANIRSELNYGFIKFDNIIQRDVFQAMCFCGGRMSDIKKYRSREHIITKPVERNNNCVSIRVRPQLVTESNYHGKVYHITTRGGMIVVKNDNNISIIDAL